MSYTNINIQEVHIKCLWTAFVYVNNFNASMVQCTHGSMHAWFNASMVQCMHGSMHAWFNASMVQC